MFVAVKKDVNGLHADDEETTRAFESKQLLITEREPKAVDKFWAETFVIRQIDVQNKEYEDGVNILQSWPILKD